MRAVIFVSVILAVAASAAGAQATPDKLAKGGGVTVKGWQGRIDPSAEKEGKKITDATFAQVGGAIHVTSGPPAIYWSASNKAGGSYTAKAAFTQTKAADHASAYGVFIGGTGLAGPRQNYLYCLITGTGAYLVKHRVGNEVHDLAARTEHEAIKRVDAAGTVTNEVAWQVTPERTSCVVNGKEVWGYASKGLIGEGKLETLDGIAGIRVNHDLAVRVSGFGITRHK
jgi:hypothetical protein